LFCTETSFKPHKATNTQAKSLAGFWAHLWYTKASFFGSSQSTAHVAESTSWWFRQAKQNLALNLSLEEKLCLYQLTYLLGVLWNI